MHSTTKSRTSISYKTLYLYEKSRADKLLLYIDELQLELQRLKSSRESHIEHIDDGLKEDINEISNVVDILEDLSLSTNAEEKEQHDNNYNITSITTSDKEIDNEGVAESNIPDISYTNSLTAKNGYKEEENVCKDLNDVDIRKTFLPILGDEYDNCDRLGGSSKCDIQSKNEILKGQVKKYKKGQFQQLDRHSVDTFITSVPEISSLSYILKNLCEYPLLPDGYHVDKSVPIKKLNSSNYSEDILTNMLNLLNKHKRNILHYAFYGTNNKNRPDYLFGVEYVENVRHKLIVFDIVEIINYLETLDFKVSKGETVLVLGEESVFSMQRKGGDGGRKGSNQLQIKIIVSKLEDKVKCIKHVL